MRTQVWYNPDLIAAYFKVPGVIGMVLYVITTLLTASSIVRERERGTIEQLIVTPFVPGNWSWGKLFPYSISGAYRYGGSSSHWTLVVQGSDQR